MRLKVQPVAPDSHRPSVGMRTVSISARQTVQLWIDWGNGDGPYLRLDTAMP